MKPDDQNKYFKTAVQGIGSLLEKGDKTAANQDIRQLVRELLGTRYEENGAKTLWKMANDPWAQDVFGETDGNAAHFDPPGAPHVKLSIDMSVNWIDSPQTYGTTTYGYVVKTIDIL